MAYATFGEFSARYPTKLGEAEVNSHFLEPASARLDAMLAPYYTVPFSSDNRTAKDISIDLAYLLLLQRSKEPRDAEGLAGLVERRIAALREGREAMVTTSGQALYRQSVAGEVWSTTREFKPIFDMREPERQRVDPDRLRDAEEADR